MRKRKQDQVEGEIELRYSLDKLNSAHRELWVYSVLLELSQVGLK